MRQITITLKKNWQVEIETSGFKGQACEAASKFVKDALGFRQEFLRSKAEAYETPEPTKVKAKALS